MRCMIEIDRGICVGWDVIGCNETNDICPFSLFYVSDYTMISVTVLFLWIEEEEALEGFTLSIIIAVKYSICHMSRLARDTWKNKEYGLFHFFFCRNEWQSVLEDGIVVYSESVCVGFKYVVWIMMLKLERNWGSDHEAIWFEGVNSGYDWESWGHVVFILLFPSFINKTHNSRLNSYPLFLAYLLLRNVNKDGWGKM